VLEESHHVLQLFQRRNVVLAFLGAEGGTLVSGMLHILQKETMLLHYSCHGLAWCIIFFREFSRCGSTSVVNLWIRGGVLRFSHCPFRADVKVLEGRVGKWIVRHQDGPHLEESAAVPKIPHRSFHGCLEKLFELPEVGAWRLLRVLELRRALHSSSWCWAMILKRSA
jgi:hypothetical protein